MRFRQTPGFAQGGCLVAKEGGKGPLRAKSGVEMALSLHGALRDLIEMRTRSCHLELDLALMQLKVTRLTEGEQIRQGILTTLLFEDDVVRLETNLVFAAVLTAIAISHQTGQAQVFIKPPGFLILACGQERIVQASDIDLNVLDGDFGNGKWQASDDANHFLDIRFDGRGQPSTALA